ncbi:MaoC family dehydratase [Streptomyces sp. NPDC086554]|uniref:MaoC family dehydratase n=1 Tax=Streptomyces sp. NPDC086554 TaxID=3154864 RepID=UPI003445C31A
MSSTTSSTATTTATTTTTTVNGLDELKKLAGSDLGASSWIEITQERINTFADATGDHQWIHTDPERAAQGPFGAPIAHGYLTLSLFIPFFTELLDVQGVTTKVNYGLDKVRFPAPVPAGSRIRLVARLASVDEVSGGVQIAVDGTVEIEGAAKPACVLRSLSRFYV